MLDLQLIATSRRIEIGRPLNFLVRVTNRTRRTIRLVPETIGFADFRYPTSHFECRAIGTKEWIDVSQNPTCGNTDPIDVRDFMEVKAGKIGTWGGQLYWNDQVKAFFQKSPGTYEFRLTYDTNAPIERWIGGPMPEPQNTLPIHEIKPYWDLAPKGIFVSKIAQVQIEPEISNVIRPLESAGG